MNPERAPKFGQNIICQGSLIDPDLIQRENFTNLDGHLTKLSKLLIIRSINILTGIEMNHFMLSKLLL